MCTKSSSSSSLNVLQSFDNVFLCTRGLHNMSYRHCPWWWWTKKVWHWHWEIEQKERKERRRETTINSRFHGTLGVPSSTVSCCRPTHLMLHKRISSSDKISAPNTEQRQCSVHDTVAAEAEYHRQQLPHLRAFVKCTNAKQQQTKWRQQ